MDLPGPEILVDGMRLPVGLRLRWGASVERLAELYDRLLRTGGLEIAFPSAIPDKLQFISQVMSRFVISIERDCPDGSGELLACFYASDTMRLRHGGIQTVWCAIAMEPSRLSVWQCVAAVRAALWMAWVAMGPSVFIAEVAEPNRGMAAVLRRAGMHCTGCIPQHMVWQGRPCAGILYCWPQSR